MRFLPFLLLIYTIAFSQSFDSLKTPNSITVFDTLKTPGKDTLAITDSTKYKSIPKRDTIISIYQKPLDEHGYFINRGEIDFTDYRYSGDLLKD